VQGCILTEAVTRHDERLGTYPPGKSPPGGQIRRQNGDLGIDRQIEKFLGTRKTERHHVPADHIPGFFEKIPHALMAPVKILTHAGVLRTLSRKDKTELTHVYFPARRQEAFSIGIISLPL
jgi:hypothetical protein